MYYDNDVIEHHGVKGMHWGVITKRYVAKGRKKKGSLDVTGSTKKSVGLLTKMSSKASKTQQKVKARLASAQQTVSTISESHKAKQITKKKQEILNSNDMSLLYKNANLFSTEELNAAKSRYAVVNSVSALASKQNADKAKSVMNNVATLGTDMQTVANTLNSGIQLWNNSAKILNTFYGTNYPEIKFNNQEQKQKQKQKQEQKQKQKQEQEQKQKQKQEQKQEQDKKSTVMAQQITTFDPDEYKTSYLKPVYAR